MIAALFVRKGGPYFGIEGVDPWDEERDARLYPGPWPVVAHPPCSRWCRLAGLVEARWGYKKGDDGGCFESALRSVRTWGGVLEHPAYSDAWIRFRLVQPSRFGGWQRGIEGGWSCQVEQVRYGHKAKKATWLYYVGATPPPRMRWGFDPDRASAVSWGTECKRPGWKAKVLVSWCGNHVSSGETRPRIGKAAAAATPPEFRDVLIEIARKCCQPCKVR